MLNRKPITRELTPPPPHHPNKHSTKSLPARGKSLAPPPTKPRTTDKRMSDVLQLYEYKVAKLLKTLHHRVEVLESFEEARKFWREECARFIECHDLRVRPVHPVGHLLIKNGNDKGKVGAFMVMYAKLLERDPHLNFETIRNYFIQHYAGTIIRNSLPFRRHFRMLTPEQENQQQQPSRTKTQTKKQPEALSNTKTPNKNPQIPSQGEVAAGETPGLKRLPTLEQARRQRKSIRKSISYREFLIKTGQKRPQDFVDPQPRQNQSPFFPTVSHQIEISDDQFRIMKNIGIDPKEVYDDSTADLSLTLNPNFLNQNMFSLIMIKRKYGRIKELPMLAISPLRKFATTDDETIRKLKQLHKITAYFRNKAVDS